MAAFDKEEVARQGRSGDIPPTWSRFTISRGTLWLNLICYGLGGVIFLLIPLYLLITDPGSQNNSPLGDGVAFVLGLIFLWIGLRVLPPVLQSARHFFLVTPDGFVQVAGKRVIGLPLAEISGARTEPGLLGSKLVVQQHSGKALVLPIGRVYGGRTLRKMEEALTASSKAQKASTASANQKKATTASSKANSTKKAKKARR